MEKHQESQNIEAGSLRQNRSPEDRRAHRPREVREDWHRGEALSIDRVLQGRKWVAWVFWRS